MIATTNVISATSSYGPGRPPRPYPDGGSGGGYPVPNPYPRPYPGPYNPAPQYPRPYPGPYNPAPQYPTPNYPSPNYPVPGAGSIPATVRNDISRATSAIQQSLNILFSIPRNDRGSEGTKQARLAAFHANETAQQLIEAHFNTRRPDVVSALRTADASLEDAAWQLARSPSPDGRFNGVNIPGAIAATNEAVALLNQVLFAD